MKFSPKYFHDNIPDWKRKKDSLICQLIVRPISYLGSSLCANLHISANAVSYFSLLIAIIGNVLFVFNNKICAIIGASLMIFWLLLDCVDGNLARSYKKQPYGEFADALSSYVLIALMGPCVAVYCYFTGGTVIPKENIWIVFAGAIISSSDTFMRLAYQKFNSTTKEMVNDGVIKDEDKDYRKDHSKVKSIKSRIESSMDYFPFVLLFAVIFNFADIYLFFIGCYYVFACLFTLGRLILKALKVRKVPYTNNFPIEDENGAK